jgi:hypothetical protein
MGVPKKSLERTIAEDAEYYRAHAESLRKFIEEEKEKKRRFPWRGRGKEETLSRQAHRDAWAKSRGYKSWNAYVYKEGRKEQMLRYLAVLSGFYRAKVPDAERLADAVFPRKDLPRKRLREDALALSKLPMLPAGKRRHVLDVSLPRYKRRSRR